jgi:acetylxylan esterase
LARRKAVELWRQPTNGFIMIFPQTTNPATSAKCWDVGSKQSLTHDGGGDTQAVAEMVKYTVTKYNANADRVYGRETRQVR